MRNILPAKASTIGSVLDANRGVGPGFDLLRLLLALMVFFAHVNFFVHPKSSAAPLLPIVHAISTRSAHAVVGVTHTMAWDGWFRPFLVGILPMFFALSGFLVAGSAFRLRRVSTFLAFRVLRLWPALITEITLSAFILGPTFTSLSTRAYFSNRGTWEYLLNLVGQIHFWLPGVFEHQESSYVNVNLWTLPAEFNCYLLTALLMVTGIFAKRRLFTIILAVATCILIPMNLFSNYAVTSEMVSADTLVYYFMIGMAVYHWRDKIPLNGGLLLAAAVLAFGLLEFRHAVFIAPIPLVYCTIWFGMLALPKLPIIRSGDFSYGIYLYGCPITQAIVAAMPFLVGHNLKLGIIAILATSLFAIFSWHCIEKPSLRFKNKLPKRFFGARPHIAVQQEPLPTGDLRATA